MACDLEDCALREWPPVLLAAVAAASAASAAAGVAQGTSRSPGAWKPLSESHLSCKGTVPVEAAVEAREEDCEEGEVEEEVEEVEGEELGGGASKS